MADKIQHRRGSKSSLPELSLGEIGLCVDTGEMFIGGGALGNIPILTLIAEAGGRLGIDTAATSDSANLITSGAVYKALQSMESGVSFTTDDTLTLEDGVLKVNTASSVEADNTLPITSAAVNVTVGNIEALLQTI